MKSISLVRLMILLLFATVFTLAGCTAAPRETPALDDTLPASLPIATDQVTATATIPPPTPTRPVATASATSSPEQTACAPAEEAAVDPAAILELGPGEGIPATTANREALVISGGVNAEDCTPLAGATLNVWQTDGNGEYGPGHGTDTMLCCYLIGSLSTDSNGRFQLITVKPAHYKGEMPPPPAHIHVEVNHPQTGVWQSEIVFAGDPYLGAGLRGYSLVTPESLPGSEGEPATLHASAEIVHNR